jgi:hypothetical protein
MELVAPLIALLNTFGFVKEWIVGGQGCLVVNEGLMKKIIALVIFVVVAATFFALAVSRHVLNTFGFAMADCNDGAGC